MNSVKSTLLVIVPFLPFFILFILGVEGVEKLGLAIVPIMMFSVMWLAHWVIFALNYAIDLDNQRSYKDE